MKKPQIFNEDGFYMKSTKTEIRDPTETDIQVDPVEMEDKNTQPEDTRPKESHQYPN